MFKFTKSVEDFINKYNKLNDELIEFIRSRRDTATLLDTAATKADEEADRAEALLKNYKA